MVDTDNNHAECWVDRLEGSWVRTGPRFTVHAGKPIRVGLFSARRSRGRLHQTGVRCNLPLERLAEKSPTLIGFPACTVNRGPVRTQLPSRRSTQHSA